jgi:DNA-binding CsgD family transcriptional regulator
MYNKSRDTSNQSQNYFDYLALLQTDTANFKEIDIASYLKKYSLLNSIMDSLPSTMYILHYPTQQYLFMTDNAHHMIGYRREEFFKGGVAWHLANMHPEDRAIISSDVFNQFLGYTRSLDKKQLKNTRFSINYRLLRKDGVYIQVLQQYVVLKVNRDGSPILTLGFCTDISSHKHDSKVVFSISHYDDNDGFTVVSTDSFPNPKVTVSQRENEILNHLIKGLSSKQIALTLHLSIHTINAHRRNILEKTNCKNTADLVNYALKNGLG